MFQSSRCEAAGLAGNTYSYRMAEIEPPLTYSSVVHIVSMCVPPLTHVGTRYQLASKKQKESKKSVLSSHVAAQLSVVTGQVAERPREAMGRRQQSSQKGV